MTPTRMVRVTTDAAGPLVVLLHGFAGTPEDLSPFASSMGVGARFVFPEGFAALSSHGFPGYGWWPSDGSGRAAATRSGIARDLSAFEPSGLQDAHDRLSAMLDSLAAEAPHTPLVIGGFSQGAMLAFDIALRSGRPIAAMVQLSGARIAARLWNPLLGRRSGMRTFISHGKSDSDLSFSATEHFRDDLLAAGWDVTFCPFEGGHEIPIVALRALKRFLKAI